MDVVTLISAARKGEAFDIETGMPQSMMPKATSPAWLKFAMDCIDVKWTDFPIEQHTAMMQAEAFMESARSMSESEINDAGLLGIAGEVQLSHLDEIRARDEAAAVLAEMERSLKAHG